MSTDHTCADHEPDLSALLDGHLTDPAAARLQHHLEGCRGCLAELDGLRRARSLLRSLPVRDVPAGVLTESAVRQREQTVVGDDRPAEDPPHRQASARKRRGVAGTAGVRSTAGIMAVTVVVIGVVMTLSGRDLIPAADVDLDVLAEGHQLLSGASGVPMPIAAWPGVDTSEEVAGVTGAAGPTSDGVVTLVTAAVRGSGVARVGETLVVMWPDGADRAAEVSGSVVATAGGATDHLMADPTGKYTISVGRIEHIMDRRCIRVDVWLAADDELREQVWIDETSGVFLRRETFEDGQRLRSVSYRMLELDAAVEPEVGATAVPILALHSATQLDALRAAGWSMPERLPGSYHLIAAAVRADLAGMPVQAVYSDGLYMLSLFVQPGQPDLGSVARPAEHIEDLTDPPASLRPGLPSQMIWSDDGRTYALVGDAPVEELTAMAAGLLDG